MKNFHVPLPDEVYQELRDHAERLKRPATTIAREAIELWIKDQQRQARHRAMAEFVARHAGSGDLD